MKRGLLAFLILLTAAGPIQAVTDSTDTSDNSAAKRSACKATSRIHSMGLFSYGGRLVCQNHVMDLHFVYNRRTWGFQFFKAFDLHDTYTPINFALAAVNKPFSVSKKLTITPHLGVVLEQFRSVADHGSDAAAFLVTAYKIHPRLTLEHTAMFGNLVLEPDMRDWVNRLRLLYSHGHLDVNLFAWHNNQVFDAVGYSTVGLSVTMARLPLSDPFTMQAGITALYMASASDERTMAGANGLFLTLGVSVN